MKQPRLSQKPISIQNIDFQNRKSFEQLLRRNLTKSQLSIILKKIQNLLKMQLQPQVLSNLNEFKKELRSKYSIKISNQIIDNFISTSEKVFCPREQLNFSVIDREIKESIEQINKKKYFLDFQSKKTTFTSKLLSADKKKRRNLHNNYIVPSNSQLRSLKNIDEMFIDEKLVIFTDYLDHNEITHLREEILKKIQVVESESYGRYADRIRHYTVFTIILQKIFSLIQENTKNIEIRKRFKRIYKNIKEQMVSIVTNEQDVMNVMRKLKNKSQQRLTRNHSKQNIKKNDQASDKEKQDLCYQIQQTFQGARKHIKQAFIKRGRPDYAYQMELLIENRTTPLSEKRKNI